VTVGTRSLIFGVHQFLWHPITVALAWRQLNGRWPDWREAVCILLHDWGYFGRPEMDGADGDRHVELGARIASGVLGRRYGLLCLLHSRHYARRIGQPPSDLCWADKSSILYERWWTYLPRAWASGELAQYRDSSAGAGALTASATDREWFAFIQSYFRDLARTRTSGPFMNASTTARGAPVRAHA
jgi:hypothetical protein